MRWEYKIVEFGTINTVPHVFKVDDKPFNGKGPESIRSRFCQQLGLDGWEMVNISFDLDGGKSIAVFKKPLPNPDTRPPFLWPYTQQPQ